MCLLGREMMQDYKVSLSPFPFLSPTPPNLNIICEKNTVCKLQLIPHYPAVKRLGEPKSQTDCSFTFYLSAWEQFSFSNPFENTSAHSIQSRDFNLFLPFFSFFFLNWQLRIITDQPIACISVYLSIDQSRGQCLTAELDFWITFGIDSELNWLDL